MYALVDRPVCALCPGSRLVLWSMRRWTQALSEQACPPGALVAAFVQAGVVDALPGLHRFMGLLNGLATERIAFAPVRLGSVTEWEAILLSLWADAAALPARAHDMLEQLIAEEGVDAAFTSLLESATRLRDGGLAPSGLAVTAPAG